MICQEGDESVEAYDGGEMVTDLLFEDGELDISSDEEEILPMAVPEEQQEQQEQQPTEMPVEQHPATVPEEEQPVAVPGGQQPDALSVTPATIPEALPEGQLSLIGLCSTDPTDKHKLMKGRIQHRGPKDPAKRAPGYQAWRETGETSRWFAYGTNARYASKDEALQAAVEYCNTG